ncbi:MAG TPA: serine acetyltransferase, partial [Flavobacterium sp.]|nr:serine acetyltransferase [Flavobacterium sp.]
HYRRSNRLLFYFFYWLLRRIKFRYALDISYRTTIGPGLYIGHFGGLVVHGDVVIGANCNLSQGVTLGVLNRGLNAGVPVLGNRVFVGPGAIVLGKVNIGDDSLIGANSLVTFDVPAKSVVSAAASQIVSQRGSAGYVENLTPFNS